MSVSQRFWSLVTVVLFTTIFLSAAAVWFTATPFLERNQIESIRSQADKDARAFEGILAQYEHLLRFVTAQENGI